VCPIRKYLSHDNYYAILLAEYDITIDVSITWVWHRQFDIPQRQKGYVNSSINISELVSFGLV
jgi:hypothetical protein